MLTDLHDKLVLKGDFDSCEELIEKAVNGKTQRWVGILKTKQKNVEVLVLSVWMYVAGDLSVPCAVSQCGVLSSSGFYMHDESQKLIESEITYHNYIWSLSFPWWQIDEFKISKHRFFMQVAGKLEVDITPVYFW